MCESHDRRPGLVLGAGALAALWVTLSAGLVHGALLIIALVATWATVPAVARFASTHGATAAPGGRSVHRESTPVLGGLAIFVPLLVGLVATGDARCVGLALGCTLMAWAGTFDDLYGLSPRPKTLWQLLAAGTLYTSGFRPPAILCPPLGGAATGVVEFAVLAAWVLLVTNAINLIDGIDGLAAGVCLVAVVACVAAGGADPVCVVLMGSLLGFLRFNLPHASVFLGDAGSLMIGFALSALLLTSAGGGNLPFAVGVLAFPLGDLALSTLRRLVRGKPVYSADRGHVHHLLLRAWSSSPRVLACLMAFASASALAVVLRPDMTGLAAVALLWGCLCVLLLHLARGRLRAILKRRRSFKRAHLLRRYAVQSLQLAESPADVLPVLARIAQDMGLASLSLRDFQVSVPRSSPYELVRESIECGTWSHVRNGHDEVYCEERRTILCDLLRLADSILEGMERRGQEPPAVAVVRNLVAADGPQRVHIIVSRTEDLMQGARLANAFDSSSGLGPVLIGTGRRDALMPSGLRLPREPDVDLDVDPGPDSSTQVAERYASLLEVLPASVTLVARRSRRAMACARAARDAGIPVAHLDGSRIGLESRLPVPVAERPLDLSVALAGSREWPEQTDAPVPVADAPLRMAQEAWSAGGPPRSGRSA